MKPIFVLLVTTSLVVGQETAPTDAPYVIVAHTGYEYAVRHGWNIMKVRYNDSQRMTAKPWRPSPFKVNFGEDASRFTENRDGILGDIAVRQRHSSPEICAALLGHILLKVRLILGSDLPHFGDKPTDSS